MSKVVVLEKWDFWGKPRRIVYRAVENDIVIQYKVGWTGPWLVADKETALNILEYYK